MKTYKVGIYYEEKGCFYVKAKSQQQAENIAYKQLENDGLDNAYKKFGYDCKDRDYNVTFSEKVEEE